jgi:hypothetical protein
MTTITRNYGQASSFATKTSVSNYDLFIERLKFNHFALISMAILIGSCAGGIAAMFVFQAGAPFWMFLLGLSISMTNLIACIAQASTKTVFNIFMLSLIINAILIISQLA